ncbi:Protein-S-isoprenylcysteine O-methyltransferase Ste14 [Aquimarina amphilecti]|uniref:Protein-S-isoprenylcysteine O-methyltransferase Ste14 n=1 Tax=Aquimarina amphilecti TaxID=1038014 RepID=A0A1H7MFZ0_AQUAM|nr:isoprenylcysteine carboxylmethyltransferase family protein [Aquimarina amphilecti]SEL09989.1 Protein-S-isoprenylcysteine O-methyltransferase Ste14 [Aquimarina amphilecti]
MKLENNDFLFVLVQFILFFVYVIDVKIVSIGWLPFINRIGLFTFVLGVLIVFISLLQLNKNLSPFPTPKLNSKLVKTGLYKFIRHPIYAGILCVVFGYGLYIGSFFKLIIATTIYMLFYFKTKYEEEKLQEFFEEYKVYKATTGRFFPRIF